MDKKYNIEHELIKGINSEWGGFGVNVNGTKFESPRENFKVISNPNEEHLKKVEAWIDEVLMTYMTRKSINTRISSYGIKHKCEKDIGEYVSNEEIKYLLALKGIPSRGTSDRVYPLNLCYPLSQDFLKRYREQ